MDQFTAFINNFLLLSSEASPWLLLGLLIAGMMKAWLPGDMLTKHLGSGKMAIVKAAFIGAPLPLCSCGVIPVATELRRSGASAPATASFLVATPETGVDSVSISYALLGPVFAIYRPITAIMSAIITGLLVTTAKVSPEKSKTNATVETEKKTSCCSSKSNVAKKDIKNEATKSSCCSTKPVISKPPKESCCSSTTNEPKIEVASSSCCGSSQSSDDSKSSTSNCCSSASNVVSESPSALNNALSKTLLGFRYATTQLVDDIIIWLLIGLIFATIVHTFLPETFLLSYGSGLTAMLLMIVISIPMYICATASTPVAAGFILAGLSPGTALVFMMAGPATNISTLGVIKHEMGSSVLVRYLLGISVCAIGFGLLLDYALAFYHIDITQQMQHSHEILPYWFGLTCTVILAFLSIKPLRKFIIK